MPPQAKCRARAGKGKWAAGRGQKKRDAKASLFTAETPFSTRYFVLRFQADGTLLQADLTKIASVTEDDTAAYLASPYGKKFGGDAL